MAERPILFSAPMVRALLAGTKTQTRRVVKGEKPGQPLDWLHAGFSPAFVAAPENHLCPYGAPGDQLWVRETCRAVERDDGLDGVHYLADGRARPIENAPEAARRWLELYTYGRGPDGAKVPAIHMPRWASRITLQVTEVRVERLQDIGEADAKAEGVEPPEAEREDHDWAICPACGGTGLHGALGEHLGYVEVDCTDCDTHAKRYRHLWERINGPGSWTANPWIWVLTFEVMK